MKDIRLEMRLRNNRLWEAIHERAPNVNAFCRLLATQGFKVQQSAVGELLNLKKPPLGKMGRYRAIARDLSEALGILPEELFPERIYSLGVPTTKALAVDSEAAFHLVAAKEMAKLPAPEEESPEAVASVHERREILRAALKDLSFREREIVKMRYGLLDGNEYTLNECATVFKVSRERIKQIEAKAIRKLQHPARAKQLEPLVRESP